MAQKIDWSKDPLFIHMAETRERMRREREAPCGDLEIRAEYDCGCQVYRDENGREVWEWGLFCSPATHGRKLVQGAEAQRGLFEGSADKLAWREASKAVEYYSRHNSWPLNVSSRAWKVITENPLMKIWNGGNDDE